MLDTGVSPGAADDGPEVPGIYLITPHFVFCDQFLSRFPEFSDTCLDRKKDGVTLLVDSRLDIILRTGMWPRE